MSVASAGGSLTPLRKPLLIGLYSSGPQQGKTTTALTIHGVLRRRGGSQIVSFATPIKMAACVFLEALGMTDTDATRAIYERKDHTLAPYTFSGRDLLGWLGTKVGREEIGPNLWVDVGMATATQILRRGHSVIIDDVRMENEADAIVAAGGHLVQVTNIGPDEFPHRKVPKTTTEGRLEEYYFASRVHNCGSLVDLQRNVNALVKGLS